LSSATPGASRLSTLGADDGGGITIHAGGSIEIEGGAFLAAVTSSTGRGGTIAMTTPRLHLDGGDINANAFGSGRAGSITLPANQLEILNHGRVFSDAVRGIGDAGEVMVEAEQLRVTGGSRISSDTFAGGAAGKVTVRAGRLSIDGAGADSFTGISSDANAGSTGHAGAVTVTASQLEVNEGGAIASTTRPNRSLRRSATSPTPRAGS
jgi:hypothetical protein